jgi:hypothetical protein
MKTLIKTKPEILKSIESHLERTTWGRGIYIPGMVVPAARPAQIRAGARKLYDVLSAQMRRVQNQVAL